MNDKEKNLSSKETFTKEQELMIEDEVMWLSSWFNNVDEEELRSLAIELIKVFKGNEKETKSSQNQHIKEELEKIMTGNLWIGMFKEDWEKFWETIE